MYGTTVFIFQMSVIDVLIMGNLWATLFTVFSATLTFSLPLQAEHGKFINTYLHVSVKLPCSESMASLGHCISVGSCIYWVLHTLPN